MRGDEDEGSRIGASHWREVRHGDATRLHRPAADPVPQILKK